MKLYTRIQMLHEIEENMPFSFESIEDEIAQEIEKGLANDFIAIEETLHFCLKNPEQVGCMMTLFINAFTKEVYVYKIEVNGDIYIDVKGNKKEAALDVLEWINGRRLILDQKVFIEEWDGDDDSDVFEYDSIVEVSKKLSELIE